MFGTIGLRALLLVGFAAALFSAGWVVNGWRHTAATEKMVAEHSIALQRASEAARKQEQLLNKKVQEVAQNAAKRQRILEERVASADLAVNGLLDDIAAANRRASENPTTAANPDAASSARELLGECAKEYSGVAKEADRLSDTVRGLQDYAASVGNKKASAGEAK